MKFAPTTLLVALMAAPAFATEKENFVSMKNPEFVIVVSFLLFAAVVIYLKVPQKIGTLLDARASGIQSELDEARALREEAQTILASYERKQKEVADLSEKIIASAKSEAQAAADQAKEDLKTAIARRLQAAQDQIASAEASAVKEVRDTAISVAVSAAGDVIAKGMSAKDGGALIDAAIKDVGDKLH
jgi:F-type H+-transporting ATPase subunit b